MLLETIKQFGGVKLINITTWDQLANCEFHAFKVLSIKRRIHPFLPFRRECVCGLENKLQKFVFLHKMH